MAEISYPADHRDIPPERFAKMMMTPEEYYAMRAERLAREEAAPEVGEAAPDFEIERLDAKGARTGAMFRFSSTLGRPVGLIFGSYT